MRHDKATMNWFRKKLALYGFLLPILAPILGFIAVDENGPDFWHSISATFYASSNILMIGVLARFSFFLWNYKGYDFGDTFICRFSALMADLVLIFPCKCSASGATTGILNLPTDLSHALHCLVAALLFGSFAYMIGFRFTKTNRALVFTKGKMLRNRAYYICCMIIVLGMVSQVYTSLKGIGWMTIVNEAIMLWAFSFAWAVKSDVFKRYFPDNTIEYGTV